MMNIQMLTSFQNLLMKVPEESRCLLLFPGVRPVPVLGCEVVVRVGL